MVLGLSGFMRLFKMCSSWASCLRVAGVGPSIAWDVGLEGVSRKRGVWLKQL